MHSITGWFRGNKYQKKETKNPKGKVSQYNGGKALHLFPFPFMFPQCFVSYLHKRFCIFHPAQYAPPTFHASITVKSQLTLKTNDFHLLSRVTLLEMGNKRIHWKLFNTNEPGEVLYVIMFLLDGVNKYMTSE